MNPRGGFHSLQQRTECVWVCCVAFSLLSNVLTNFLPLFSALKCELEFVSSFQVISSWIKSLSSPNKALIVKLDFAGKVNESVMQPSVSLWFSNVMTEWCWGPFGPGRLSGDSVDLQRDAGLTWFVTWVVGDESSGQCPVSEAFYSCFEWMQLYLSFSSFLMMNRERGGK